MFKFFRKNSSEKAAECTPIHGEMPVDQILVRLTEHGCKDVSTRLKRQKASLLPVSTGGAGNIYKGTLTDNTEVAIKCLRLKLGSSAESQKDLRRAAHELYVWSKCQHPNVLELTGVAVFYGQIAMVSPWMEKGTVTWFVSQNPMIDRYALCAQIGEGVTYLHDNDFVHGDLKGANILVSSDGVPKITDFGTANMSKYTLRFDKTTGLPGMTLRWAAPELVKGESGHTTCSDIYALGMTFLEVVTGSEPYCNVSEQGVMWKIVQRTLPHRPIEHFPTGLVHHDQFWSLLETCWAYNRQDRPTASEVLQQMRLIAPREPDYQSVSDVLSVLGTFGYEDCTDILAASEVNAILEEFVDYDKFEATSYDSAGQSTIYTFICPKVSYFKDQRTAILHHMRDFYFWSKCKHPGIIKLFGVAEYCGHLAMVYPPSTRSYASYLSSHPEADRLQLCAQIADAVAYLHSQGIVYGNLVDSKILVSDSGSAFLKDSGNAVLGSSGVLFRRDPVLEPYFYHEFDAPECDSTQRIPTKEVDIWALGLMMAMVVTGHDPGTLGFEARPQYTRIPEQPIVDVLRNPRGECLWEVVRACRCPKPKDRPSAATVLDELKAIADMPSNQDQSQGWKLFNLFGATSTKWRISINNQTPIPSGWGISSDAVDYRSRPEEFYPVFVRTPPFKSTQLDMDQSLMNKMRGAIFRDPEFVGNFLTPDANQMPVLAQALEQCPDDYCGTLGTAITAESGLYQPALDALNSINDIVDSARKLHGLGTPGSDFVDYHANSFAGSYPDIDPIKPDLVMFEGGAENWETLVIPIDVKAKHTYLKAGMKRLARCARMIFAHQIYRRHVYGMVICQWAVTFVRFDRSGKLHSKPIDMREKPKEFQRAFAGLMMLDRDGFGYDTALSTERREGRIEYYIDLPAESIPPTDGSEQAPPASTIRAGDGAKATSPHPTPQLLLTRRFKVMERLCHRQSICGRATIVLRLQEVQQRTGEPGRESGLGHLTRQLTKELQDNKDEPGWELVPGGRDYVLKPLWRDPHMYKHPESEVLKRLVNSYGVVHCLYHSDVLKGTGCHEPGARTYETCHDATPAREVEEASNLSDLDIEVPDENEGEEPQYADVDMNCFTGKLYLYRVARVYTWILVASVGKLLRTAKNAREMLEAVLDAMLGYWHAVNRGILHRDISEGNVLLMRSASELDMTSRPEGTLQTEPPTTNATDPLMRSKQLLQQALASLEREPRGFLCDYDLFTTHSGMELEFFGEHSRRENANSGVQTSNTEVTTKMRPDSKRRKSTQGSTASSHGAGKSQERDQSGSVNLPPAITSTSNAYQLLDFRVGTPAFMSSRVLDIPLGERYEHHFMDDLQSFFWLIYRCVVQHIDSDPNGFAHPPNATAVRLLNQLNPTNSELENMAVIKTGILAQCDGGGIKKKLEACENSWAIDSIVVRVVQKLGTYFHGIMKATYTRPITQYTPETEFPIAIRIILEAPRGHPVPESH